MKRIVFALLLLAGAAPAAAPRQKGREIHPCESYGSQAEATACAGKEYRAADAELNRVYKQLMSKLDAGQQGFLKKAEAAWINYRNANCDYEDSFYAGGTMRPMITAFCMARVTRARTAELLLQIKNLEDE
jgi:uncharacterized protein YecT (DUF1311 family)